MPQNLVSLDLSADQIAAMDQAIATLEAARNIARGSFINPAL